MSRRVTPAVGVALVSRGGVVLVGGASVTTGDRPLQAGDGQVTSKARRAIPPWVGGVAVGIGVVLLVSGARRRI